MISLIEINKAVEKYKVSAETIEKDYVISWILYCLSKSSIPSDFTFYGGTAIKRIYFEDHRFSEDIDLISTKFFSLSELIKKFNVLQLAYDDANLQLSLDENKIFKEESRLIMFINYIGYDEIVGAKKEIRIDFAMNRDAFGEVEKKEIISSYTDLQTKAVRLNVMSLNSILANKLGLLLDRTEPRDVFDIHFLLLRTKKFNFDFEKISRFFKNKYGFLPKLNLLKSSLNKNALKINWKLRLEKQVEELEDYEKVCKEINDALIDF